MTSKELIDDYIKQCKPPKDAGGYYHLGISWKREDKLAQFEQIRKDLEVLEVLKKFFNFNAYYAKNLNSDFLEIIAKEDKEANIDRKAISFIDSDSRKLLEEWLKNGNNNR